MPARCRLAAAVACASLCALPACKKNDDGTGPGMNLDSNPKSISASENNLKTIAIAMQGFHDTHGNFPGGIWGPGGKAPGLSWRVQLLPYLDEDALYKEFKLDEAWDSPHNQKLVARMPKVYAPPGTDDYNGHTFYCSFQGPDTFLLPPPQSPGNPPKAIKSKTPINPAQSAKPGDFIRGRRIVGITDGTGYTIMVAEAGEPVVWSKPEDIAFNPAGPLPKLGGIFRERTNVVMVAGTIAHITPNSPPEMVKAYITANGGERHTRGDPNEDLNP